MTIELVPGDTPEGTPIKFPFGRLPGKYECVQCGNRFSLAAADGVVWWRGSEVLVVCFVCRTPQIVDVPPLPHAKKVEEVE